MQLSTQDPETRQSIRKEMGTIAGVERVVFDDDALILVCESHGATAPALASARERAQRLGLALPMTAMVPASALRERVRLDHVQRIEDPDMRVRVRVTLEWMGRSVSGEAVGEKGEALELRTTATATLAALAEVMDPPLNLRLAGIKPIRAFDAELMVVSLYRPTAVRNLLGAVLVAGDARRAAAQAVLHALNRVLGNFLVV